MENASKALIIAGAILLSISIIAIGMAVFRNAQSAMEGAGLTTEQITTYNSKFETYQGTKNGSVARELCDAVRNHNLSNTDDESKHIKIVITENAPTEVSDKLIDATEINNIKKNIKSGKTYKIDFGYNAKSGLIVGVSIVEQK